MSCGSCGLAVDFHPGKPDGELLSKICHDVACSCWSHWGKPKGNQKRFLRRCEPNAVRLGSPKHFVSFKIYSISIFQTLRNRSCVIVDYLKRLSYYFNVFLCVLKGGRGSGRENAGDRVFCASGKVCFSAAFAAWDE